MPQYKGNSLVGLYDLISAIIENLEYGIQKEPFVEALMPSVMDMWNGLKDEDPSIFPLFECMQLIAENLQTMFQPFCETVTSKCLDVILNIASQLSDAKENVFVQKEYLIRGLEVLTSVFKGMLGLTPENIDLL